MGTLTIHKYDQKTKKWTDISDSDIDGGFSNENYLYKKYFPDKPVQENRASIIPLSEINNFHENLHKIKNLEWYEKVIFRLTHHTNFFKGKDLDLVLKALSVMELANPTNHPMVPSFNTGLKSFLIKQKLNPDDIISFGYSSGGFWGTDPDSVINSITTKISDSLHDKLADNININPRYFGVDMFYDYSDDEKERIKLW